ncbi:hypothetical protein ACH3XW_26765 [Acanthocheilonema viteae]|uniref:Uncharacterized protein n=1 Tax=Acanthocheilonema viteae TaxID=6277 RepID=A0A498S464_ACAVI|nr:unnamed protein product [Acanthocheilonema viteae]
MCLHTRGASQWDVSKTRSGDRKTATEVSKEAKRNPKKNASDNDGKKKRENFTTQLVTTETQKTSLSNERDSNESKLRRTNNHNKNSKPNGLNEKNQQLANSFIAEFTQKSISKSGIASSTCKKSESVIRDNTLEDIPRDMPKYDS